MTKYYLPLLILATLTSQAKAIQPEIAFFEAKIRPVLVSQCYSCHSSRNNDVKGNLALDSREGLLKGGDSGPTIVVGDPDKSLLIKALEHTDFEMPPDEKLSNNIISDFKLWIKNGAIDPRVKISDRKMELAQAKKFWSFKPVHSPIIQSMEDNKSNLDKIILSKLERENLKQVGRANNHTILRRVYFDLIGLPPTVEEIENYINDKDPKRYEKLIDKLLADQRFGEKWGRHWLDVARYADSTGKDQNIVYPYAWKYRDYVISSFNKDKSYSQFIIEQIAGDLLPHKNYDEYNEHLLATGFLAVGTKNLTENPKQFKADLIDEQIDSVTRGFLGITLSCARCHDHKFDPLSQKDYYAMYGIFQNITTLDGVDRGNNNIGYDGSLGYLVDSLGKPLYEKKQAEIWGLLCDIRNIDRRIGTIRSFNPNLNENDKKQVTNELEKLDKELETKVTKIKEAGLSDLMIKLLISPNPVMCVKENEKPVNAKVMVRGDVNNLGEEVPRSVPEMFVDKKPNHNPNNPNMSGRLELAQWIADKGNPLTYRVYINRVWKVLFGQGIIDSFDNFGSLGGEPTNAKIMDYLVIKFIQKKYSTKALLKEIMMSDSYQMSTRFDKDSYEKDPDNLYFWRMNEKRLEAESIRDTLLYIAKELNPTKKNHDFTFNNDKRRLDGKINGELNSARYRSIYLPVPRDFDIEMLDVFDRPDNNLLSANRSVTTVPTQALYLMNNDQILNHCTAVAKQLEASHKDKTDEEKIQYLYLKYLCRKPIDKEIGLLKKHIEVSDKNKVYQDIIHILILTGEFREIK
jgi:hypothetical protein